MSGDGFDSGAVGDAFREGYVGANGEFAPDGAGAFAATVFEDVTLFAGGAGLVRGAAVAAGRFGKGVSAADKAGDAATVAANLTKSQQKSIRSLEKRIREHQAKLDEFKNSPTVRPGMENMSAGAIAKQQARRISHLEKEISTFRANIDKIKAGGLN